MNKTYLTLILLIFSINIFSQEKVKVITSVAENNNEINVKWYSKNVFIDKAVDIYRTESNTENWIKLNSTAIKKQNQIPESLLQKDEIFNILNNVLSGNKNEENNGFIIIAVMIKSVEYPGFADYLGIQYFDKTATKGNSYKYKIVAIDNNKTLGISEAITFNNYKLNSAPDSASIDILNNIPSISWKADENTFFGYNVYRSGNSKSEKQKISKQPIIVSKNEKGEYSKYSFNDDTLNIGETYYYQIKGINYFGQESEFSKELVAIIKDITPPPPPSSLKIEVTGKIILLNWETINVPDLSGYNIYKSKEKYGSYAKINKEIVSKDNQIYIDTAQNVGVLYYKISSVDTSDNEAFSYVYPADIKDVFPPETPKQVLCKSDTGKIFISWKENSETDLDGYLIYRTINKNDKSKFSLLNTEPIKTNKYTDVLPKEAKNKFLYKIVAIDTSSNKSEYSDYAVTSLPDIIAPKKPIIKSISANEESLQIEWFQNFEVDLAGYDVYRKAKNDTTAQNEKLNINTISKNVIVFTDIFAEPRVQYTYSIVAFDTSGNYSEFSDVYPAVLLNKNKNDFSFSNFKATYNKNKKQVKLTWKIKDIDNIKGFMVYKKDNANSKLKPITGLINELEYIDKKIKAKSSLAYQIRVFTKSGLIIKSDEKIIAIEIE